MNQKKFGKITITAPTTSPSSSVDQDMDTSDSSHAGGSFVFKVPTIPPTRGQRQIECKSVSTTPVGPRAVFFEEEDDSEYTAPTEVKEGHAYEDIALDDVIALKKQMATQSGSGLNFPESGESSDGSEYAERRSTPMSALRKLVEMGMSITLADKEITSLDAEGARAHRWRAEWTCGELKGVGEGGRKVLAEQAGALDLVEKLKKHQPELDVPFCRIPVGCLVNPFIFCKLDQLVKDYAEPVYQMRVIEPKRPNGRPKFVCICFVNDKKFLGESTSHTYAKRFAAKRAYEEISGEFFRLDQVIKGDKCFDEKSFLAVESETNRQYKIIGSGGTGDSGTEQIRMDRKRKTQKENSPVIQPRRNPFLRTESVGVDSMLGSNLGSCSLSPIVKKNRVSPMLESHPQRALDRTPMPRPRKTEPPPKNVNPTNGYVEYDDSSDDEEVGLKKK